MDDHEQDAGTVVSMTPPRRRAAPRKAAPRKPATARKTARPAARRKAPARRRKAARGPSFEAVIQSITTGVTVARAAIAEASDQGVAAVRRAVGDASKVSRRTVTRLAAEWKSMDPKKKAGVLAALLGAAAAASAPLVRKSFKK